MRFVPNDFQYNGRVATALVPSLVVLAGFGGKYPVGVLLVSASTSNDHQNVYSDIVETASGKFCSPVLRELAGPA